MIFWDTYRRILYVYLRYDGNKRQNMLQNKEGRIMLHGPFSVGDTLASLVV